MGMTEAVPSSAGRQITLHAPPPRSSSPLTPSQYRELVTGTSPSSPIVIDLGSSLLRAGFASDLQSLSGPRLVYPPFVARARDGKRGLAERKNHLGYDAFHPSVRSSARSAFDGALATNPWGLERLLDGTLSRLGLANEESITHPFLVTEPVANPNGARSMLMEVLFEGYGAPGVALGIDALYSYLANSPAPHTAYRSENALVLSLGHYATHLLPIVGGNVFRAGIRRISLGGAHMVDLLARRMALEYPDLSSAFASNEMVTNLRDEACYVAQSSYVKEVGRMASDEEFFEDQRITVKVPGEQIGGHVDENEAERKAKARKEQGRRLYEMMKAKREAAAAKKESEMEGDAEKGSQTAEDLEDVEEDVPFEKEEAEKLEPVLEKVYQFRRLRELQTEDEDDFYLKLVYHGMKTISDLESRAKKREKAYEAAKGTLGLKKAASIERAWCARRTEDQLLSTSDDKLSPEELKRKRKIRSMRAANAFREQVRKQKEEERLAPEEAAQELRRRKEEDPAGYVSDLLEERNALETRVRHRAAASEAGSDRRSHAARQRMRLLAQQISSGGGNGKKGEDTFGADDADWEVYREIEEGAAGEDAVDKKRLDDIEREFLDVAPQHAAANRKPPRGAATLFYPPQRQNELYLVVNRVRPPEILWQPSLVGSDQVGLAEAIMISLNSVPASDRRKLIREVFVTGSGAKLPGLRERLFYELQMNLPTDWGSEIAINFANDLEHDAWRGAALFAQHGGEHFERALVRRADYEEMGPEYVKEHLASNLFIPTPLLDKEQERKRKKKKV